MAVVFEDRRSRVKREKAKAINSKALMAFSIPALLGVLAFAIAIANEMQQRENWTAGAVVIVLTVLLIVVMIIGRRRDAQSTKSTSSK